MIPKIFHRIWFGKASMPEDYEKYWMAWQRQFPNYEFRTWRDEDIQQLTKSKSKIAEIDNPVSKSDIARYEILYQYGGIYLDCDIIPYHYFDPSRFNSSLIVCNEIEPDDYCSIGFIAAEPNHPILLWAVKEICGRPLGLLPPNRETGPFFFQEALQHGSFQKLPKNCFYPYLYNEPRSAIIERDLSVTYGIHLWGGAWFTEQERLQKALQRMQWGDLEECEELLSNIDSPFTISIIDFCSIERRAREAVLQAIKHPLLSKLCKTTNKKAFDLLKTSFFLLHHQPDEIVWQIGACDGILADPLRPLLINFDPTSILLEPNPYLFERLKKNYSKNRNVKFLNAAFGANPGICKLNAINSAKIDKTLPEWVNGISSFFKDRNAISGRDGQLEFDQATTKMIAESIETIDVKMIDANGLLNESSGRHPAILVIDVEGMEYEVLNEIFTSSIKPYIIQYEFKCLPPNEQKLISELLEEEYISIGFDNNVVAYRKDFFVAYCDYIFTNNGVSTIYKEAQQMIMGIRPENS